MRTRPKGSRMKTFLAVIFSVMLTFTMMPVMPFMTGDAHADTGDVTINEANFPDTTFKQWVKDNIKGAGDNVLTTSEIAGVTSIYVPNESISSLKGIEYFTSLTDLYCNNNSLTTLDVSKNTALQTLCCNANQLTNLDVRNKTALTSLTCSRNKLTTLDVSNNTKLTNLNCYNNSLTSLDVRSNTALEILWCNINKLTALDVSKNTALTKLYCYNNSLTALDVSQNKALQSLWCYSNSLTALDVSKNPSLETLYCGDNQLTSLDLRAQKFTDDNNISLNQTPVLQASFVNGKYVVDLKAIDQNIDVTKITNLKVNGQDYTLNNGEITFDTLPAAGDQVITYTYATGCNTGSVDKAKTMTVSASVSYTPAPPAPATYSVTLNGNGGAGSALTTYTEGTGATLPADWTKDGYTFAGWYDNEGLTGDAVTAITSTDSGAKTYYAKWTLDKPAAPKGVKAKAAGKHSVKLTWSKADGADRYKVYMAKSKAKSAKSAAAAGKYKYIGKTEGTSFAAKGLKAGTKYYFIVKAVNDAGTAKSSAVIAKTAKEPVSFTLTNVSGNNVKVRWSKVSGASKYQVASNSSGKMKTKWTGANSTCAYTSTNLTKGKTYKFKMRYYKLKNGKKVYSSWSSVKSIKVK